MRKADLLYFFLGTFSLLYVSLVHAEDPYRFYTWEVTYGTISPLGVPQQGILINGQFPGPTIDAVTNDNVVVNVFNKLDEPFLITWNGIQQRKTSWQDGVLGTNCPIQPGQNWTYHFQVKDQIGTFSYFPSTAMHRAAGGFGGFNVDQRSVISKPYPEPDGEFTLVIGDWYKTNHKTLRQKLDSGMNLPLPDGLLINGRSQGATFSGEQGKTYKFKVSNVGIATSFNFRIQGHLMKLIEVEGSHTMQEVYDTIDVHVGQSIAVLVTLQASPKDYYIVASSRFTKPVLTNAAILRYAGSKISASGPLPVGPTYQIHWSMKHARTIRLNLTANAARPNPQGAYHYGQIPIVRTYVLANEETKINGKLRYAVNKISHVDPPTPLKLADWFSIPGVFDFKTFRDKPNALSPALGANVVNVMLHDYVEFVFQNNETTIQSWHLDGSSFFVAGYGGGEWSTKLRRKYNFNDGVFRHTVQVYPSAWTAILVPLDNKGMWNLRSAIWARRYLGQQLYLKVWNDEHSLFTEYDIPENALLCGLAKGKQI